MPHIVGLTERADALEPSPDGILRLFPLRLHADPSRVVIRPFHLGWQATTANTSRAEKLVADILDLDETTVESEYAGILNDFAVRHWQIEAVFEERCAEVASAIEVPDFISTARRRLIGAYFCHEYSYAAAALMNPSVVPHPDQSDMGEGEVRFIMMALHDRGQCLDHPFQTFSGTNQSEGCDDIAACQSEPRLEHVFTSEGAVRRTMGDHAYRRRIGTIARDQQVPAMLRHHHDRAGTADQKPQDMLLLWRRSGQHGVQRQHDRRHYLLDQIADISSVRATKDAEFVLNPYHIRTTFVDAPRRQCIIGRLPPGHDAGRAGIGYGATRLRQRVDINRDFGMIARQLRPHIGRECRDPALKRRISADQCHPQRMRIGRGRRSCKQGRAGSRFVSQCRSGRDAAN